MPSPMIYLKLFVAGKPVRGESRMKGYEDQIAIESATWSFDVEHENKDKDFGRQTHTNARSTPGRVTLTKHFDRATTVLCSHVDQQSEFSMATVTVLSMVLSGHQGSNSKMMTLQLSGGVVESIDLTAAESGNALAVRETLTLTFKTLKLMYFPVDVRRVGREAPSTFDFSTTYFSKT